MVELYRYAAFISYSSRDAAFAKRLHRALERYGIPNALGKFDLLGSGGKKNRIYPVFRDREELSAGDLGELIQANLKASGALIVVCSPNAAASPWVQKEIEHFVGLGRPDRIFAIIADTAPLRDSAGADATPASFPPVFRGDALADPDALEPLAADARKGKDGFRNAWLKVVAGLVGVTPGQLIDRDRKRRRQRTAALTSALALAAVSAAVIGSIYQTSLWRGQLTTFALELASSGDSLGSQSFALAGEGGLLTLNPGRTARADESLQRVWNPSGTKIIDARPGNFHFSDDGRYVATLGADGRIAIYDFASGAVKLDIGDWGEIDDFVFSSNGRFVLVDTKDDRLVLHDLDSPSAVVEAGKSADVMSYAVSADGGTVATILDNGKGRYIRLKPNPTPVEIGDMGEVGGIFGDESEFLALSGDGRYLFTSADTQSVRVYDLDNDAAMMDLGEGVDGFKLSADGMKLVVDEGKSYTFYDLSKGWSPTALDFVPMGSSFDLSGDGSIMITKATTSRDPSEGATVFDIPRRTKIAEIPGYRDVGYSHLSASGRTLLVSHKDRTIELFGLAADSPKITLGYLGRLFSADVSANGRFVMAVGWDKLGVVQDLTALPPKPGAARVRGGELAAMVCATSGGVLLPFSQEQRDGGNGAGKSISTTPTVRSALRGRPWNPCDWRGFGAVMPNAARGDGWFEGARQWARLIGVRYFGRPDYRCGEGNAAGRITPDRERACRLAQGRDPVP